VALLAVLILTGCGVGFGAGDESGSAGLTVTRDYGSQVLVDEAVGGLGQSSTAMRLLDGAAEIETRYGGGFVQSIDGISGSGGARSFDWFYFVNGIAADRGAAEFVIAPGDRMWWDHRDWTDAMNVNAVVGSYPEPMKSGYEDREWPVVVQCREQQGPACDLVSDQLAADGVEISTGEPGPESMRVMVGAWPALRSDPVASRLDSAPAVSGVFARFGREGGEGGSVTLTGLDQRGGAAAGFGPATGLLAALRTGEDPPVWVITGTDPDGVSLAAAALGEANLRHRYAAVVFDGKVASLPIPDAAAGAAP